MAHFDVSGGILRDGISELSLKKVDGLHLGFEEIIKERTQDDPRAQSTHFSLHLDGKKVSDILDELSNLDTRYTWSRDGGTVNVYPRASAEDPSYLLNLWIDNIAFEKIPVPDQALTPLSKLFPEQQVGYFPGLGNNTYSKPWTASFARLTVRQFINRLAEYMGQETSWIWQGGKDERMFIFLKGGFHTRYECCIWISVWAIGREAQVAIGEGLREASGKIPNQAPSPISGWRVGLLNG